MSKATVNANRQRVAKPVGYAGLLSGGMFVVDYALLLLVARPIQAGSLPSVIYSFERGLIAVANLFAPPSGNYAYWLISNSSSCSRKLIGE